MSGAEANGHRPTDHRPMASQAAAPAAVYVAVPIDEVDRIIESGSEVQKAAAHALYADVANLTGDLADLGLAVYRPDQAWDTSGVTAACPAVEVANRVALEQASCVVAFLPREIPTIGTVLEIAAAAQAGTPVVVVTGGRLSHSLATTPGVLQVDTAMHALTTVRQWQATGQLSGRRPPIPLPFTVDPLVGGWALPRRFHRDDAGVDLHVTHATTVESGEFMDVPAGCRVQLPAGTWGLILGRSSTIRKRGLLVVPGVIDVGWRGELFVGVLNAGHHTQTVKVGDRIGQFIVLPNLTERYAPVRVDALSEHARGEQGFGSTGGYQDAGTYPTAPAPSATTPAPAGAEEASHA